jgi:hypothetical protein
MRESLSCAARGRHAAVAVIVLAWTVTGLVTGAGVPGRHSPPDVSTRSVVSPPAIGRRSLPGNPARATPGRTLAAALVPVPRLRPH